jgi:hypothetical protein
MLAAQQAPIGAKICTVRAIRTMGRNLRNRRRIEKPPVRDRQLIMQRVPSRDRVPGDATVARIYGRQRQNEIDPQQTKQAMSA